MSNKLSSFAASLATRSPARILVFGGYGTFGEHVVRTLAGRGFAVTVSGRSLTRAETLSRAVGLNCTSLAANVTNPSSYAAALATHAVAVNCAGPYTDLGLGLVEACCEAGVHYVDLADDRQFVQEVRKLGARFAARDLTAAVGCSSLPGISGALAHVARSASTANVQRMRITLFIGNNNPKGASAVNSAVRQLGRAIAAPQGTVRGFRDPAIVVLPSPFGRRRVLNFESPDYDLLAAEFAPPAIEVKVGFESRVATLLFRAFASWAPAAGRLILPKLRAFNGIARHFGTSGGVVMAECFFADGTKSTAALVAPENGQRMAALPAALAAERLARQECPRGAVTAYQLFGARELLAALEKEGFQLVTEQSAFSQPEA